jgi:voltage-gated potassium channel
MIKNAIYRLVVKGSHGSRINLVFDYSIMILILLNVVAIVLESVPSIQSSIGRYLTGFEIFSVVIFTIEYLLRIYVSDLTHPSDRKIKSIFKFIFSTYGLIDLAAVAPFYLPFLIRVDLRFLRILRLMRFLRVLKINRYNRSLNLIWKVIKEKRTEFAITLFITFIILLISSFLMFYIEGEVQPDKFPNIIACLWWAVATLTTIGYGDVYPVTAMGKFISGLIAIIGIGLVALPAGLVTAGFMEKIGKKNKKMKKCPHCGKEIER